MGAKKWIQGLLPVFNEPILPGDFVKVKALKPKFDADATDIGADEYVGKRGTVTDFSPEGLYPYEVTFSDDAVFWYGLDELERQA